MGTTVLLVVVGVVIFGVAIFSFQFANGGTADVDSEADTKENAKK